MSRFLMGVLMASVLISPLSGRADCTFLFGEVNVRLERQKLSERLEELEEFLVSDVIKVEKWKKNESLEILWFPVVATTVLGAVAGLNETFSEMIRNVPQVGYLIAVALSGVVVLSTVLSHRIHSARPLASETIKQNYRDRVGAIQETQTKFVRGLPDEVIEQMREYRDETLGPLLGDPVKRSQAIDDLNAFSLWGRSEQGEHWLRNFAQTREGKEWIKGYIETLLQHTHEMNRLMLAEGSSLEELKVKDMDPLSERLLKVLTPKETPAVR